MKHEKNHSQETPFKSQGTGSKELLDQLDGLLQDEMKLFHMTHLSHWNAEGPNFYSFHKLTDAQYKEMLQVVDDVAERKRALGGKVKAYTNVTDSGNFQDSCRIALRNSLLT